MTNKSVFGVYLTQGGVECAVECLRSEGFRNTDISILCPQLEGSQDTSKVPEGAAAGAGAGALLGGTLGWLAGSGVLAVPGVGPFIAAGPIIALLAGISVGGTLGGVGGALVGMGLPEYEAKIFAGRVGKGAILLSIHCDNQEWVAIAQNVLHNTGAEDISTSSELRSEYDKSDTPAIHLHSVSLPQSAQ